MEIAGDILFKQRVWFHGAGNAGQRDVERKKSHKQKREAFTEVILGITRLR